jgi:hypothetical protein
LYDVSAAYMNGLSTLMKYKQELRAAGIGGSGQGSGRKRKYIDYGKEIPFEKTGILQIFCENVTIILASNPFIANICYDLFLAVPVGYYDVSGEDARASRDENSTEFVGKVHNCSFLPCIRLITCKMSVAHCRFGRKMER